MPAILLLHAAAALAWAQPRFEAADVHASPKSQAPAAPVRAGRYEIRNATMLNLIRTAYPFSSDRIVGGPSWLELDRYDVIAKVPAGTTPDTRKLMLQALLAERFHLVVHPDTRPLPGYVLVAGKKPLLKAAQGSDPAGCRVDESPIEGGRAQRVPPQVAASSGLPATIQLGPGSAIQYLCRNMTMAAFADSLHAMMGAGPDANPIGDETGLEGKWNFEIRLPPPFVSAGAGAVVKTMDAVDKQLGLKMEERPVPTRVLMVESADRTPTANPPGTEEALPAIPSPTAFDVASVRPVGNSPGGGRGMRVQPGGRFTAENAPMRNLLDGAFDNLRNAELIAGIPDWALTERFNIEAKTPDTDPSDPIGLDAIAPLLRALLVERFKMTYHTEQRPVTAYSLVAVKPKLKKADPASRSTCKYDPVPPGSPPGSSVILCQNLTVAQFAERLQGRTRELVWPVLDSTGVEGSWDFTLVYNAAAGPAMGAGRGAPDGAAMAAEPSANVTIFDAMEKQLGLRLEKVKRNEPIFVIDHLEQRPTEN